ncbi:Mur ligase domain-containing protein [Actinomadura oligospora]|uniref:Mur ligase domain-containing protein n=1 Tax=Actinomadura oligospora TaxID=111804 RepID=UPI0012F734A5|nr:Mur ligase domain-containing protein [Actinomadura oligospora]
MTETRHGAPAPTWVPGVDVSRPHLIGCDGIGMSALAALYIGAGRTFTGWDRKRRAFSRVLCSDSTSARFLFLQVRGP